ncbi:MAG: phenylalanine--tRNA ligase subunit beta [Lachnospiraceae bacterium]|nr:phenylalanine--tRNA ligase subunit beta [Lachnospiraceae bacterium]
MYISINWIRDFVDLSGEDIEKLIQRFTLSTAEVEGIEYKGKDVENVVVGEILTCEAHPDSDHLHLLTVDGGNEVYKVVCGAPNARAGIKTAFAKPGARVGKLVIKPTVLRGQESNGMCCSGKELGISDDHSGILELDESLINGTDLKTLFPIEDIIFEVDNKSLTNRPDLWGHYGIAREFAALTKKPLKPLPIMEDPYDGPERVPVEIKNDTLAYRYTSLRVENIKKHESPMEMQIRLFYCGTRAINLLADLTNYLMLELGQPTHAFDGNKITKIIVDTPKESFTFQTLDGNDREITPDTLMIYDNDTPVAIAGIMGGLDSEIVEDTDSVVLESANFEAVCIRKSATRLGLRTDASARYEKTLDPELTMLAAKRFIKLISDIDPDCRFVTGITDVYPTHYPALTVEIDKAFVDRYTGIDISPDRIEETLNALGFAPERNEESFICHVPSYRATKDVSMKADIVEEITRIFGYDNFEIKTTRSPLIPAKTTRRRYEENQIKDLLVKTYAMHEVHTRIWCDPDELRNIGLTPEDNVRLLGSSDEQDTGILRTTLMESFLPLIYNNRNYQPDFGVFEIGRAVHGLNAEGTADERRMLGIALYSKTKNEKTLYIEAVGLINAIADELKHEKVSYQKTEPVHVWQHPKNTVRVSIGKTEIGMLNTVHPKTLSKISKNGVIVCIEIDMDKLLSVEPVAFAFDEPSRFPAVEYDLSLLLKDGVRFEDIEKCWQALEIKALKNVSVVDIYDAELVKSVTLRFVFCLDDRTLTGEEVQEHIDAILEKLSGIGVKLKA